MVNIARTCGSAKKEKGELMNGLRKKSQRKKRDTKSELVVQLALAKSQARPRDKKENNTAFPTHRV